MSFPLSKLFGGLSGDKLIWLILGAVIVYYYWQNKKSANEDQYS